MPCHWPAWLHVTRKKLSTAKTGKLSHPTCVTALYSLGRQSPDVMLSEISKVNSLSLIFFRFHVSVCPESVTYISIGKFNIELLDSDIYFGDIDQPKAPHTGKQGRTNWRLTSIKTQRVVLCSAYLPSMYLSSTAMPWQVRHNNMIGSTINLCNSRSEIHSDIRI